MKTIIIIVTLFFGFAVNAQVHVNGYYRQNGTYVEPYMRSSPNSTLTDNYSYPGNINPYTGKVAPGNPDTYQNSSSSSNSASKIWVQGYTKSDGTWVSGYWRSASNDNYFVNTSKLDVRSGPASDYPIITSLELGNNVEVLEMSNTSNWEKIRINLPNQFFIGYVPNGYLALSTQSISNDGNRVIFSPHYLSKEVEEIEISKIETTNEYTIVSFVYKAPSKFGNEGWIRLSKDIYLKETNGDRKYYLLKAIGIPLAPDKYYTKELGSIIYFSAYFDRIANNINQFDIIECPDSKAGCFNFYGVNIN